MRIAILGYGAQGKAAYEYWNKLGSELTICDSNAALATPNGVQTKLGQDYLKDLAKFDLLVRTPALHPRDIVAANPDQPNILDKVTTVTNEFFKVCPTKNIIGVTGTKGKGTTSTLIAKMLEASGKKVHLGGNIGTPPLDMLKAGIQPNDWLVLELANFQLIDLKASPAIAVCLMVVPEHMDWHSDMNDYIAAKQQLFAHQSSSNAAIYYGLNPTSQHIASVSPGQKIPYMKHPGADVIENAVVIDGQTICKVDKLKLLGKHNWQNVCAAVTTVWQIDKNVEAIRSVITTFTGLEHRLELVRELNGVTYYNDSFASVPDATIAAIKAIDQPKVVIVGGFERGLDLTELTQAFVANQSTISKVLCIGVTGSKVAESLKKAGFTNYEVVAEKSMNNIVKKTQSTAQSGDAVLLSPGFASFDMFKNFEERGLQFKEAVNAL